MPVTVELQIFSGRRDPIWTLTTTQVMQLTALIDDLDEYTLLKPPGVAGGLGYRGFMVRSTGADHHEIALAPESSLFIHAGVVDMHWRMQNLVDTGNHVERWLLGSSGPALDQDTRIHIERLFYFSPAVPAPHALRKRRKPIHRAPRQDVPTPVPQPRCRPQYDPAPWNLPANIGPNHCYNYAADKMTGSAAVPGEGSGTECCQTDPATNCLHITQAAVRDLLVPTSNTGPTPANQHLVALVIEPAGTFLRDFHWYRRDCNGEWSHKIGNTFARNVDESGVLITDPSTCDRGTYTQFCGYFLCDPSVVLVP